MIDPKCKRFHRVCEDFSICVNIGEKGYVIAEHSNERFSAFYYPIYGKGKFGKLYDPNYKILESKKILDIQEYMEDSVVFQADEDFHMIGFNTLDKNIKWGCIQVTPDLKSIKLDSDVNFIICLNGKMKVNIKNFKRYDYAKLEKGKEYNLENLEKSESCIFYQL